jgi:type I restriction enzyme M protein
MLDTITKRRIDTARDILVGKLPDPKSQVEQITIALIYKFMDDMDKQSEELGGEATFFTGEYEKYSWSKIFDPRVSGYELVGLYGEAIQKMNHNPNIPQLFRDIFKNAYLPYRDPETLKMFLKVIGEFEYDHSEKLGDAFEYLLSIMGSQGDAGQFRTPRHIIDFMVKVVDPCKDETVLDPACGTAGFLISSILNKNKKDNRLNLTADERTRLINNFSGYDISPDMVRLSLVNMYLHKFPVPKIYEYDTLTSEEKWNEFYDVILANPPFMSPKGGIKPHKRFSIQAKRSEVLFVDYIAEHLNPNGRGGVIVPEGIIFQSGNAYKKLRKMLIENSLCVVASLPAGVFNPYSGVKTSILFLNKNLSKKTDEILFVKVNHDGFGLGAQRRKIKENDLPMALEIIKKYKQSINEGKEIEFNLSEVYNGKWDFVELGEVCEFIRGVTYKSTDETNNKNGCGVLRANNIDIDNKLNLKEIKYIRKDLQLDETKKLHKNDIFICIASGSKKHLGKVAYIKRELPYFCGGFMAMLRSKDNILPKYLFYTLISKEYSNFINNLTVGVNINNLKSSQLFKFKIPLPPLEIQEQIIAQLDSYQKIIDGARQVVENYKPTFKIDPKWEIVKLEKTCNVKTGKLNANAAVKDGKYPFFTCSKEIFKIDDFAFNCEAILLSGNNATGNFDVKYYKGKFNAYQRTYVITIRESYLSKLTYTLLQNTLENSLELLKKQSIGGLTRYLTLNMITSIKVPLPPIHIQHQIVAQIKKEQKIINANKELITIFENKIKDKIADVWGE